MVQGTAASRDRSVRRTTLESVRYEETGRKACAYLGRVDNVLPLRVLDITPFLTLFPHPQTTLRHPESLVQFPRTINVERERTIETLSIRGDESVRTRRDEDDVQWWDDRSGFVVFSDRDGRCGCR